MLERLLSLLNTISTPKVLLIGDFMLDNYLYGNTERISPEAPVMVLNVTEREERPGGAGSVAVNLAALGAEVSCLGVVGNDSNGVRLREMLSELKGIDTKGLLSVEGRPTTFKQRVIGLTQHRHRQQLVRIDEECSVAIDSDVQNELMGLFERLLDACDVVCLEDYNKGVLCDSFCQEIIQRARACDKGVLIDAAMISDYSRYKGAWLVKPNRSELALVTGIDACDEESFGRAARQLSQSYDIENIVVTLDKQGACVYCRDANMANEQPCVEMVPTRPRSVYDGTGAGDMFLSALVLLAGNGPWTQDCGGATISEMVHVANVAGGLEVERFGCVGITREEVVADIISQSRPLAGKLRSLKALVSELQWHRQHDMKIVFTNGCFDLLHPGHIGLLSAAKAQGDVLVVAINSDRSVRNIKGPKRPILKEQDRAALLSALEAVDYVIIFDSPDPLELIEAVSPDVLVKGSDWTGAVVGQDWVESHGGKVVLVELSKGFSTTGIIEQVIDKNSKQSSESVVSNE